MLKDKANLTPGNESPVVTENENILNKKYIKIGTHVLSNVPLQVSLYFNLIFFPFWLLVYLCMLDDKFERLSNLYKFIFMLTLSTVVLIECVRLYIGYKGNLREKIADLAGFWLVTFLLQTPLQVFLLFSSGLKPSAIEDIIQSTMCVFLMSQLIFGLFALRNSSKHSTLMFHLTNVPSEELKNYQ